MRKPSVTVAVVVMMVAGLSARQTQPLTVPAGQVRSFIGQVLVVEDTVVQVSREPQSGFIYLNFGAEFPKQVFRAVIPMAVEQYLVGPVLQPGKVRVRGLAQLGPAGLPEILCSDPSQLTSLGASPNTAANTALSAVGGAATPQATPTPAAKGCCRVCTNSKPCGNGCIARTSTCRQPPGCACGG